MRTRMKVRHPRMKVRHPEATTPVRCVVCRKRLRARYSGDGRWSVGTHDDPATGRQCLGFHRGDHIPVHQRQETPA